MHQNAERIASILVALGVRGAVYELSESTRTALEAAEALGCPVGAIANSLVFMADDDPVLILASGAHRVDTSLVAGLIGASELRRASADEVRAATGQAIGGVAPIGHPLPLRTYLDDALRRYETIWAAAGTPHSVFPTSFTELARICGALEITVSSL